MTLADKIQPHITIDTSGKDQDTLEIRGDDGTPAKVLFTKQLYDGIAAEAVVLPDGTPLNREDLQLAFEQALIAETGMCVLEHDYHRSGFPELAKLARSARGASHED